MSEREKIVEITARALQENGRADSWDELATAALTALEAAGYVIAPSDPTQAMCVNGGIAFEDAAFGEQKLVFEAAGGAYRAMLAAKEP